jgi:hypothetical protein
MIRALVTLTIAAVPAYVIGLIAYWVMYHVAGLRFRTADHVAFYVFCTAIPVLWAVLFFWMRLRRAPRPRRSARLNGCPARPSAG